MKSDRAERAEEQKEKVLEKEWVGAQWRYAGCRNCFSFGGGCGLFNACPGQVYIK
jgi:hypothetical protein